MKVALILGGAACLADDRARAADLLTPDTIIATNHAGKDEPGPVPHWATMHPELFPLWLRERRAAALPDPGDLWCRIGAPVPAGIVCRRAPSWGGSSGLLAVCVALDLGYQRIVLAGVPLTKTPHFDDERPWRDAERYRSAWSLRRAKIEPFVRSMSGWTAKLLGEPTREWIDGA